VDSDCSYSSVFSIPTMGKLSVLLCDSRNVTCVLFVVQQLDVVPKAAFPTFTLCVPGGLTVCSWLTDKSSVPTVLILLWVM